MPSYRYTFISHAHADNALCDPLAAAFARLGVPHYYDRANPQIGHDIGEALDRELQQAQVLVVLASPQSLASPWVREEINIFFTLMMREPMRLLIPVKVAPCDLPPRLEARWWVDAVGRPAQEVVAELARALDESSDAGNGPAALVTPIPRAATHAHHAPAEGPMAQEVHTAFARENWGDVLDKTDILIERGTMTPTLWRERATAAFALSEARAGLAAVDEALKADPDDADTLLLRARLFVKAGDDAQAVTTFTRAYALAPLDASATRLRILDDLTVALARLGRWDEFTRRVADAHRIAPEDPQWLLRPIEALLLAQRFDEAIRAAQSLPSGVSVTPLLPAWKNAIAGAVRTENWSARRALLDAAQAACADPATIAHWRWIEFPRFTTLSTLSSHTNSVSSVAWAPDSARLATASWDKTTRVWEAASGRLLAIFSGHVGYVHGVAWTPDGRRLATAGNDNTARVWGAASGQLLATLSGHTGSVSSVAWSPDGAQLVTASADTTARVWEAASGRLLATLSGHISAVWSVTWSPDGAHLATASHDRTARVWEAASGRLLATLSGHTGYVSSVAWSPDGAHLATASHDRTAQVWEAASGRLLATLSGHTSGVNSVAWSPEGARLATASADTTARVWEAASGRLLATLSGHTNSMRSVAWSPEGARLATASADTTARVWEAASGRLLATLSGHTGSVWSVAWSPEGARLATASADTTARVWGEE